MFRVIYVFMLMCLITGASRAGESGPVMNGIPSAKKGKAVIVGKTTSPTACELRAKAALALSATKEGKTKSVAPVPRDKTDAKIGCPCGPDCNCPDGVCPKCAVVKSAIPALTVTYFQRGNIIYECSGGTCRAVGTVR